MAGYPKLKGEIIWTGGLPLLNGLPHIRRVPHLHVNRPSEYNNLAEDVNKEFS